MGLITSRLNLESLNAGRPRSQQDETLYSYSLNKNYFSNYFLMGGERFEVNDPDYLFGDNCDLNFLSCTKPCSLPYKQAQQNLLSNLSTKQKAINKVSSRVNRLGSPFNIFSVRQRQTTSFSKHDSRAQSSLGSKGSGRGADSSQPLVMFINIRKETLRLVKSSTFYNLDSDLNSLTNSVSTSEHQTSSVCVKPVRKHSLSRQAKKSLPQQQQQQTQISNRHSASSSHATTSTIHPNEMNYATDDDSGEQATSNPCPKKLESDIGSLVSATSSIKSGYTSIKGEVPMDDSSEDDDEDFKDALNDSTNLSLNDDDDSEKTQQQRSLLGEIKENRDIKITIEPLDDNIAGSTSDSKTNSVGDNQLNDDGNSKKISGTQQAKRSSSTRRLTRSPSQIATAITNTDTKNENGTRVYNIDFEFDAEVDCTIRIFYFCTREITSSGISYKPQHATYKSKIYHYKKGLNQKFDQQEHTFQPYLFDEDLLIYKPLDIDGNYNSGAVFPIVIQCTALEGSTPRQSQSLVATIEKSQLDDSYSIKPLKQLIFVDGVQYILQDIYGIENKPFASTKTTKGGGTSSNNKTNQARNFSNSTRVKSHSLQSSLNGSNLNLSDTASVASVDFSLSSRQTRGSLISNNRLKTNDNSFECVICMSEERDTMLLPCRHLCLCSACAQSLRYQANSCPICRCPFKAALNLRPIRRSSKLSDESTITTTTATKALNSGSTPTVSTSLSSSKLTTIKKSTTPYVEIEDSIEMRNKESLVSRKRNQVSDSSNERDGSTLASCGKFHDTTATTATMSTTSSAAPPTGGCCRRESVTTSATPLLSAPVDVVVNLDSYGRNSSSIATIAPNSYRKSNSISSVTQASNTIVSSVEQQKDLSPGSSLPSSSATADNYQTQGLEMRSMNVQWRPSSSSSSCSAAGAASNEQQQQK